MAEECCILALNTMAIKVRVLRRVIKMINDFNTPQGGHKTSSISISSQTCHYHIFNLSNLCLGIKMKI